ncbi:hypothetical protein [Williamsoniiplasma luminosum]|uniref:Uncharacterized protein n=1 Tax=Williamsoniiplasma luminosum TaxID=214888 RepID=A0A2S0NKG8_9MOLU|nr:hypothetical protein [Williamsoniiplasma luminosum]AVP49506.1 MAG: hypothetical protein C5T88_02930 [Williamsoniiplasma luminosum]
MKLAILLTTGLLSTSPIITIMPNMIKNVQTKQGNYDFENLIMILQKQINPKNEKQIKSIFLNALITKNGVLSLDQEKIREIKNPTIEKIFLDSKFATILNQAYMSKMITFQNNKFAFKSSQLLTSTPGFWLEAYWYWFGYAKLHFGDELVEKLIKAYPRDAEEFQGAIEQLVPELSFFHLMTGAMGKILERNGGIPYIQKLNCDHTGIWFSTWVYLDAYGPWAEWGEPK